MNLLAGAERRAEQTLVRTEMGCSSSKPDTFTAAPAAEAAKRTAATPADVKLEPAPTAAPTATASTVPEPAVEPAVDAAPSFEVEVPEGATPGDKLRTTYEGKVLQVTVPGFWRTTWFNFRLNQ